MRKLIFILLIINCSHILFADINFYKSEEFELEFKFDMAGVYSYYDSDGFGKFHLGELQPGLELKFQDGYSANVEIDFSNSSNDEDYFFKIKDIYLDKKINKNHSIKIGKYKTPFGEEYSLGDNERTYINHYNITDEFCLGRDIGVSIYGKKVFNLLGYKIGIFNNQELLDGGAETAFSLVGNIFIQDKVFKNSKYKIGYNIYDSIFFKEIPMQNFTHGLYTDFFFGINNSQDISFLLEYFESKIFASVMNDYFYWKRGGGALLSYRYNKFSICCTFEFYDDSVTKVSDESFINTGGGVSFELNKFLTTKMQYNYEYRLNTIVNSLTGEICVSL